MEEDPLITALEKRRKTPLLKRWLADPVGLIEEKPYLLIFISGGIGIIFFSIVFFSHAMSTPNLIITTILAIILPPGLYDSFRKRKIAAIEADFPDLLRDMAFSIKSGLTIHNALKTAAQGEYGKLNEGVRAMAREMSWGYHFEETLKRFAERYPTPLIKRAISIIVNSVKIGGETGLILDTVATNTDDIRNREKKRRADTVPYIAITYVTFLVFVGIIVMIYTQFIPMMVEMSQKPVSRGMQFAFVVSPRHIAIYKTSFFHAIIIQGFGGGIMAGKIGEGSVIAGIKHSVIMVLICYLAYFLFMI